MERFYANTVVRAPRQAVIDALRLEGIDAYVAPEAEDCAVFSDRRADAGDQAWIEEIGPGLSATLAAPCLTVLNHGDQGLMLWLFVDGRLAALTLTLTGVYGGDEPPSPARDMAWGVARAYRRPRAEAAMRRVLGAPSLPMLGFRAAIDRHAALCRAMELPEAIAGFGYGIAEAGALRPPELLEACLKV